MKKICHLVGTRPQYIKLWPLYQQLDQSFGLQQFVFDTGQHYDKNMSTELLDEFGLLEKVDVGDAKNYVGGGQMASMLASCWSYLEKHAPDYCIVYGDTNSTLAGALAAKKLGIKIGHVEAGVRTDPSVGVQEGINRLIVDTVSTDLFAATKADLENLNQVIVSGEKLFTGDLMGDAFNLMRQRLEHRHPSAQKEFHGRKKKVLLTLHRAENVDDLKRLKYLFDSIGGLSEMANVQLPLHPRLKAMLSAEGSGNLLPDNIEITSPLKYSDLIDALLDSDCVMTDSGGLPKDAAWAGLRCFVFRTDPIWTELYKAGYIVTEQTDVLLQEQLSRFVLSSQTGALPSISAGGAAASIASCIGRSIGADI